MKKLTPEESRLLYALLDAAEEDGLIRGTEAEFGWGAIKLRVNTLKYHAEGEKLWVLLSALDSAGKLDGSWMQARWHTVRNTVLSRS